ncbi:hypothetical protein GCM10010112_86940 [Actinoplanes lobatus]|uniref:Uncharacterized protein n=1 Tax=Actinoplanes lobatus TaxID=113568 RepID=A0A7W7MEY3_9ACTN|nr:hypothetical protein [Actinoplanes lobatus]MBB4747767.1 hypothetical protein [Actinoplanes lobatus]GGN96051.1 hypothetical protein GCM10010112_86940 [Actinoplanes lobatus]GIE45158.1 hypothetical protein Alo02nite_80560 [Actinoplanes lobatus]
MITADRLAAYGHRLVSAIHQGNPDTVLDDLARLDRAELVHLVMLLAASVPDADRPGLDDLVRERFAPLRGGRR